MTLTLRAGLAFILFVSGAVVGCSDDVGSEGTADEALTAADADFTEGDQLTTTARLNLRAGPALSAEIKTVMPRGATVTVSAPNRGEPTANPTGAFFHVTYGGQQGWAHGAYMDKSSTPAPRPTGTSPPDNPPAPQPAAGGGNAACMAKIAQAARSVDGQGSGGRCYHYVKEHIGEALGIGFEGVQEMVGSGYQVNAYEFAKWLDEDPGGRASSSGFVKADIPIDQLPVGSIIVWQRGQCGYSSASGHIEVVIGGGRACSDFCGHIKTSCGAPTVAVYTKGC